MQETHLGTLLVKGESDTTLWQKEKDLGTGKTHSYQYYIDIQTLMIKGKHIDTLLMKGERGKRSSASGTSIYIPYCKRERVQDTQIIRQAERPNHTASGKAQSDQQGGQRPSPTRVPTRTSRRAGIGQGDLPHTRVSTSSLRMQGDHKEQHSSHSLNRWKERFAL